MRTCQHRSRSGRSLAALWLLALLLGGCPKASEPQTADDADDPCGPAAKVEHAGETAGSAIATGGKTAWEGTKTFGRSVGGLLSGGVDEAEQEWDEGAEETRETAREGADETRAKARATPCPAD